MAKDLKQLEKENMTLRERVRQLEHSQQFLDLIVENIPHMIFVKDAEELRFMLFNRAGEELIGFKREEMIGKNDYDFFPKEQADFFVGKDREVLSQTENVEIEGEEIDTAHGKRFLNTKKIPIFEGAAPKFLLGISQDVTDKKRIQEELLAAKEKAQKASESKSLFLANMSHEIRTPMNGVIGIAELLLDTALNEEQQKYASTIKMSAQSLLTIINDILDFSKIEAGKLEFYERAVNLRTELRELEDILSVQIDKKEIQFILNVFENVPERVVCDPGRLRQVILNLISNSIKFTEAGGAVIVTVELLKEQDGNAHLKCSISDTGVGIPPEKQEAVFKAFAQADNTVQATFGGTGLGLSISKALVRQMGGQINLASEPGKGTMFSLQAPFKIVCDDVVHSEDGVQEGGASASYRILLAEDNSVNAMLARTILEKDGHEVFHVENGKEAVDFLNDTVVDIVLMDIQMPVMDGVAAAEIIRANERTATVPIVALTASAMKGAREHYLSIGMNDYVSKPFKKQSLLNVIYSLCEQS